MAVRRVRRLETLSADPGTYAVVLRCAEEARVTVGRLGECRLEPGYYVYVGSALGPGGVRARVMRHRRHDKVRRWHIDYLSDRVSFVEAWCTYDPRRREHEWVEALSGSGLRPCLRGFGSSDCRCYSHLLYSSRRPRVNSSSAGPSAPR